MTAQMDINTALTGSINYGKCGFGLKITVKCVPALLFTESLSGKEEIILPDGSTVEDLLQILSEKHGQNFIKQIYNQESKVFSYIVFLVNGREISLLDGFKTKLFDKSKVAIILPMAGG